MNLFNSRTVTIERDADGSAMVILDHKEEAGNRVNLSLVRDLSAGLDVVTKQNSIPVLILRSGKKNNFAFGPDLDEWLSLQTPSQVAEWQNEGIQLIKKLASLPMPTIAAIHGPCLGPGLELALACDYLLAYDRPDTVFAFTETELGAIPPWGSLYYLARRVGLEKAVRLTIFGEKWKVPAAKRNGLIDLAALDETSLRAGFQKLTGLALRDGKRINTNPGKGSFRRWLLEGNPVGRYLLMRGLKRFLEKRQREQNSTGGKTLELLKAIFFEKSFDTSAKKVAVFFPELLASQPCRNALQMARQDIDRLPAIRDNSNTPQCVLLSGEGNSLAQWAYLHISKGIGINLHCENATHLGAVLLSLEKMIRETVRKGFWTNQEAQKRLSMIEGITNNHASRPTQLAIAFQTSAQGGSFIEKFQECSPECTLVRGGEIPQENSPTKWQARLVEQLPLGRFPCCEIEFQPSAKEFEKELLLGWLSRLGKQTIVTQNGQKSVTNQLFFRGLQECLEAIAEGISPDALEQSLRQWGFVHGPLFWADWLGNSKVLELAQTLPTVPVEILDILENLVTRKWQGVESGKGWFLHRGASWWVNPLARNIVINKLKKTADPVTKAMNKKLRVQDARDRVVFLLLGETARLAATQVIATREDWDYLWVRGLGWPARLGGPFNWVKNQGEEFWENQARHFGRLGTRFQIPPEWKLYFSSSNFR